MNIITFVILYKISNGFYITRSVWFCDLAFFIQEPGYYLDPDSRP